MPDSIPGSWLGMVLSLGSTVGGERPRPHENVCPVATPVATTSIDSRPPASAGCVHPRDPIMHAAHWFMSSSVILGKMDLLPALPNCGNARNVSYIHPFMDGSRLHPSGACHSVH